MLSNLFRRPMGNFNPSTSIIVNITMSRRLRILCCSIFGVQVVQKLFALFHLNAFRSENSPLLILSSMQLDCDSSSVLSMMVIHGHNYILAMGVIQMTQFSLVAHVFFYLLKAATQLARQVISFPPHSSRTRICTAPSMPSPGNVCG